MNDSSSNYTEYVVAQKAEGAWVTRRILLIALYVFVGIAWLVGVVGILKIWPLGMFLPIIVWMLVFFTWRYVAVEYEYTMASGTVTFSHIYGRRSRRTIAEYKIKDMTKIAPATEEYKKDYAAPDVAVLHDFRGSKDTPDAYFMLLTDPAGKKGVIFFEATAKAVKICQFYNRIGTVASTTLRY